VGAVLKIRGLRHTRGGRQVLAIDSLDVAAGERVALLGPNGAGKTTLLRLLAVLDLPTAGTVELDGVPTGGAGVEARRRIAYATQRAGLLSTSVVKNVELPLRWRGVPREARRRRALVALERLNAAQLAERRAATLSGGEAQRASLARALALDPALLLLDEPAAGLDVEARRAFFDDLDTALADRATTVVHVSHRAEEALRLADRVAVLSAGSVLQLADPSTVLTRPANAAVARLVGYENVLPGEVDDRGRVLVAGRPSGVTGERRPGRGWLAAWAGAVRVGPPAHDGVTAVVQRISPGPGRWELALDAGVPVHAHVPLDREAPSPGDRVRLDFRPERSTFIMGE
jgi:ABC-type Fe3+/spermidine/putrescine transport system ATPase subunit